MESPKKRNAEARDPSFADVRKRFSYNPETGDLIRKSGRGDKCRGKALSGWYRTVTIDGSTLQAHRIAYIWMYGCIPSGMQIDHINGVRSDNRIENLRPVTPSVNARNRAAARNNTSGISGIYWSSAEKRWKAKVRLNGQAHHLGTFKDKGDAAEAIAAFRASHGFTERHGLSAKAGGQ